MYMRRSARVVLMNPAGAVLLVRSRFRSEIAGPGMGVVRAGRRAGAG